MKVIRIAIAGALLASTLLFAASCGKKCDVCGKTSMNTKEVLGVVVCDDCINSLSSFGF